MSPGTGHVLLVEGHEVGQVLLADTYLRRLRGMLLRRRLPPSLLLVPGGSVHGVGMTVGLDVAVLVPAPPATSRQGPAPTRTPGPGAGPDRAARLGDMVVAKVARLRPFLLVGAVRGTVAVLETPVGGLERWGVGVGSTVRVVPSRPQAQ